MVCLSFFYFFFFQAEDGIRDLTVTGVQTCALPIFMLGVLRKPAWMSALSALVSAFVVALGVYGMPVKLALISTIYGAAFGIFPIADRKSTRLNSSHSQISYAVFCLKKKKQYHPLGH